MRELKFTVPGKPAPAGSKVPFKGKNGHFGVRESNPRSKPWQGEVKAQAAEAMRLSGNIEVMTEPLSLVVTFYMPRPKGHFGSGKNADKLKATAPGYPTGAPDATKLLRGTEDAMTGIVYRDDAQIVNQVVRKRYADGHQIGAEIEITEIADGSL